MGGYRSLLESKGLSTDLMIEKIRRQKFVNQGGPITLHVNGKSIGQVTEIKFELCGDDIGNVEGR